MKYILIDANCIGQKRIERIYFYQCCKKQPILALYVLLHMINAVLYALHIRDDQTFYKCRWQYLKKVENPFEIAELTAEELDRYCYEWFHNRDLKSDILFCDIPCFILEKIQSKFHIQYAYGLEINETGELSKPYQSIHEILNKICDHFFITDCYQRQSTLSVPVAIKQVVNGKVCNTSAEKRHEYWISLFKDLTILTIVSLFALIITLMYTTLHVNLDLIGSIFTDFVLFMMNFIPIILLYFLFYFISGTISRSIIVTSFLLIVMCFINYFKLLYRDEPFKIADILLIQEAGDMTTKYNISFGFVHFVTIAFFIMVIAIIKNLYIEVKQTYKIRAMGIFLITIIAYSGFHSLYLNTTLYRSHPDTYVLNKNSETQQFQMRGFVYSFLYSYTYAVDVEPDFYNETAAKEVLSHYTYESMQEDQKANIIAIMLESYNDFSKFDSIEFENDPYVFFHELNSQAMSGTMVSNIFAGGTINTERAFLGGYQNHPGYQKTTNSFVHYFNEQGYYTDAMHPSYGWFYNRRNINTYLGFQNYYYLENYFEHIVEDEKLFQDIISGFEQNKERNQPYFNFTVTYQNHGPYSDKNIADQVYVKRNDTIEDEPYYLLNNYLSGIAKTDQALKELISYFEQEDEPVIIILFGDHNPLLGDGNSSYIQNGISLDQSTLEGFQNYYETPYVYWGNKAAQKMYNRSFDEDLPKCSPLFLLPNLFSYLGFQGNEYMSYLQDIYDTMPVMNNAYYQINGKWTPSLTEEELKFYDSFVNVEYYVSHNFNVKSDNTK